MPKKKLRIAIFHLAFVYAGGGERLVLEEAIGLSKLGYEVTCFSPIIDFNECYPELMENVKVKRLFPRLPSWFPDMALFSILMSCILTPLLFFRFRNYDLYFGANQPGPWISYVLSKINKKPYAIYLAQPTRLVHPRLIDQKTGLKIIDGFTSLNFITRIFKPLISILDAKSIRGTRLIFANGSYAKWVLDEVYGVKTVNCPAAAHNNNTGFVNGKIKKRFEGTVRLANKIIKKPYILLTNRHFPQKKFEYAIEAVSMFGKDRPRLIITGKQTEYTKYLRKKIKNKDSIQFVGLLSEKELSKIYENSAIYVYPSPEEDFGMGIVEAMSFGIPVVAWENAGPTGIIKNGFDGLLAKPLSVSDYSACINKLLRDKNLYKKISKNAYDKIRKNFTYEIHNKILDNNIRLYLKNFTP